MSQVLLLVQGCRIRRQAAQHEHIAYCLLGTCLHAMAIGFSVSSTCHGFVGTTVRSILQCRWTRLLLVLDAHIEETVLSEMFGQLQEKVMWLAERPYLAEGMPLKILTLLSTLFQVLACLLIVKSSCFLHHLCLS